MCYKEIAIFSIKKMMLREISWKRNENYFWDMLKFANLTEKHHLDNNVEFNVSVHLNIIKLQSWAEARNY